MCNGTNINNELLKFTDDGITPRVIERPSSIRELSELLLHCNQENTGIIPFGGKTRIHIGNPPLNYSVAVNLDKLPKYINHEPGDMTVIASSNVIVRELSEQLKNNDQKLPFEVEQSGYATIGGSVASDAEGRPQSSNGGIRDWIIGMENLTNTGKTTKSGGHVVKNVQGYDLHKLHIGGFGSLGVIKDCAFKLQPIPEQTESIITTFDDFDTASSLCMQIFNFHFVPESLVLSNKTSDKNTTKLSLRLCGRKVGVERQKKEILNLFGENHLIEPHIISNDDQINYWDTLPTQKSDLKIKISTTPLNIVPTIKFVKSVADSKSVKTRYLSDFAFGNIMIDFFDCNNESVISIIDEINSQINNLLQSLVIQKCDTALKNNFDVFFLEDSNKPVMLRIKNQYDPNRIFNAGRFAGKL